MEDMDLDFEDYDYDEYDDLGDEGEEAGGEQQNRTFIILVAVMGAVLLLGIAIFCVWIVVFAGRGLGGNQVTDAPTQPAEETIISPDDGTVAVTITEAATAIGGDTAPTQPSTTGSATPRPSRTPASATTAATAIAEVTETPTPEEAATNTPVATTPATSGDTPADTGFGVLTAIILAAGLLVLLFMARGLRTAQ